MENIWQQITNDFIDDTPNGGLIVYIDAFETGDDDEPGETIARVYGNVTNGSFYTEEEYWDERAREDKYAQEVIQEAKEILKKELEV